METKWKNRGSRIQNGDEDASLRESASFFPASHIKSTTFMAELENCLFYSHRLLRFLVVLVELLLELSSPGGGGGGGGMP